MEWQDCDMKVKGWNDGNKKISGFNIISAWYGYDASSGFWKG